MCLFHKISFSLSIAVGKSKKIAKRAAASKLLQAVRQLQNDNSSTAVLDEEEDELPLVSDFICSKVSR